MMKSLPVRSNPVRTARDPETEAYRVDYPTHAEMLGQLPSDSRRYMVGVPVYDKMDMIGWMLEGISRNFKPAETRVVFYFDGCRDDSLLVFENLVWYYLTRRDCPATAIVGPVQVYEGPSHNALIEEFMRTDSEFLVVPQDDQTFDGPIAHTLEALKSALPSNLGVIGGRDGFSFYENTKAAGMQREWAGGPPVNPPPNIRLADGVWRDAEFINTGPVVYNRRLVETIGALDPQFRNYYHIEDYCYRARLVGFRNIVAGMPVVHAKFGRYGVSVVYEPGFVDADHALIRQKVPSHP